MQLDVREHISTYLAALPPSRRADMEDLHARIMSIMPNDTLWFLDGKDETGKVVSNPNIGYGLLTLHYADGKTKPFYQIGISLNTTGISIYMMGIADKKYLSATYGKTIGKANITAYCIKLKTLQDIDMQVLTQAIQDIVQQTS